MTRDCGREGSRYPNLTGTHSHFRGVVLPPHLLGLPDHSQSTALLGMRSGHPSVKPQGVTRVPKLKMLVPGREDIEDTAGPRNR
ncbi:unnamed protein product [Staurois parvus]|uniref:Uncharacterized protein n=1 Tax=Staurois parvus TaxID=386267 RepID=A0ABN9FXR1_9NEOB|nr:unnamed protein product [Staurois parvus]